MRVLGEPAALKSEPGTAREWARQGPQCLPEPIGGKGVRDSCSTPSPSPNSEAGFVPSWTLASPTAQLPPFCTASCLPSAPRSSSRRRRAPGRQPHPASSGGSWVARHRVWVVCTDRPREPAAARAADARNGMTKMIAAEHRDVRAVYRPTHILREGKQEQHGPEDRRIDSPSDSTDGGGAGRDGSRQGMAKRQVSCRTPQASWRWSIARRHRTSPTPVQGRS